MARCQKCGRQIDRYPCPFCGFGGEAKFGKAEGGTGQRRAT